MSEFFFILKHSAASVSKPHNEPLYLGGLSMGNFLLLYLILNWTSGQILAIKNLLLF
jgi:hypothetical protein